MYNEDMSQLKLKIYSILEYCILLFLYFYYTKKLEFDILGYEIMSSPFYGDCVNSSFSPLHFMTDLTRVVCG